MKQVTCLDCELVFQNDEKDAMLMEMLGHYKEKHPEIIGNVDERGKAEWMAEFHRRWGNG